MKAPFAESVRAVQIRIEIPEPNEQGRLVARRTVGSKAPSHDGLAETFVIDASNLGEFVEWAMNWLVGDGTFRWLQLGREADLVARTKLNPRKRVSLKPHLRPEKESP